MKRSKAGARKRAAQERPPWRPKLVGRRGRRRPAGEKELAERVQRARRAVYALYAELRYFLDCPRAHRERLRAQMSWPDVGYVTSLARALSEEERLADWARFNSALSGDGFNPELKERSA